MKTKMKSAFSGFLWVLVCFLAIISLSCSDAADSRRRACEPAPAKLQGQDTASGAYAVTIEKDIAYLGPGRGEKCDIYTPTGPKTNERFGGIVIIHGGGWRSGDKGKSREQNIGTTLAKAGYVCISINYLLAKQDQPTWPRNLQDCKTAVQFLRKNARRLNLDPDNIGVIGGSAGGHLAAMVGLTGTDNTFEPPGPYQGISSEVQAVVPMYGIYDLVKAEPFKPAWQWFLGKTRQQDPNLYASASPVTHIDANDPPFLILHGSADTVVNYSQSIELHDKLARSGVKSRLILIDRAVHSFDLQPPQRDLRPVVIEFFDEFLKDKSPARTKEGN